MPFDAWMGCVGPRSAELRLLRAPQGEPGTGGVAGQGHGAGEPSAHPTSLSPLCLELPGVWSLAVRRDPLRWVCGWPSCASSRLQAPHLPQLDGTGRPGPAVPAAARASLHRGLDGEKSFLFGPQCGCEGGPEGGQLL